MLAMIIGGYIGQKLGLIYTYYITIIPFFLDFFVLHMLKVNNDFKKTSIENNITIQKMDLMKLEIIHIY